MRHDNRSAKDIADERLYELILLLAMFSEGDENFGAVKLNKLLFFCDFLAYLRLGKSITRQTYFKLEHGPAPKRLLHVMAQMENALDIVVRKRDFFGHAQSKPIAMRPPEMKHFDQSVRELVQEVVSKFWKWNGKEISELSHDYIASHRFLGWRLAEMRETIPYSVSLLDRGKLTEKESMHAKKVEKRAAEWLAARAG